MTAFASLPQIVAQALLPGAVKAPDALLGEIAAGKHSIEVFSSHDATNQLFYALYSEFDFLRAASASVTSLQQHELDLWASLLRWLIRELRQWRVADDTTTEKLAAIIVIAQVNDVQGQLWSALPNDIRSNAELLDAFRRLVSSFSLAFVSTDIARTPLWESVAVEKFKQADAALDWVAIGENWRIFEQVAQPNVLQRQVVQALFRYDLGKLVDASNNVHQTAVAMQIAKVLTTQQRLELAIASQNPYVQFAGAYQTVTHSAGAEPLTQAEIGLFEKLLVIVAADTPRWTGWMQVFNGYPVRYPTLQIPLGRCLARASDAAIEAYVNAVVLYPSPVRSPVLAADEVAGCLREFRSVAQLDRRQLLWTQAHERWQHWQFDQANPDTNLFAVNRCQIDYALVGFACECMDQMQRDKALDDIRERLERAEDTWHPSMTDLLTTWNRLLSQMQPYAHAQTVLASGGDWLPKKQYYLPFDPSKNRYLALRYRMTEP